MLIPATITATPDSISIPTPKKESSQSLVLSKYILKALGGVAQLLVVDQEIAAVTVVLTERRLRVKPTAIHYPLPRHGVRV